MDIVPMSEGYTVTGKTYFESEIPHESLIVIILTVEGRKTEAVFQLPYDFQLGTNALVNVCPNHKVIAPSICKFLPHNVFFC